MGSDLINILVITAIIIFGVPLAGVGVYLKTKNRFFIYGAMVLDFFCFICIVTWLLLK